MQTNEFEAAQDALVAARRDARPIDPAGAAWRPADLAEAYRLQAAVADALGPVAGWKVAAVNEAQRHALGVAVPIGAPLLRPYLHDASERPPELRFGAFIRPLLECELAFELGRDVPPRPGAPYERAEVEAAVAGLRIGVEIVDYRLPRGCGTLAELADAFNNGAYVRGSLFPAWRQLDLAAQAIVLHGTDEGAAERRELARGSGAAILDGDPFGTVVLLANAQPAGSRGLRAGDLVTTGTCTGAPALPGPGLYEAEFAGLGTVAFRVVP